MSGSDIFWFLCLIIPLIIQIGVMGLFVYKRDSYLIKQRKYPLVLFEGVFLFLATAKVSFTQTSYGATASACTFNGVANALTWTPVSCIIVLRLFLLYLWHFFSDTTLKVYEKGSINECGLHKIERFIYNHRASLTTMRCSLAAFLIGLPGTLAALAMAAKDCSATTAVTVIPYTTSVLVITIVIVREVRGKPDNFKFQDELKGTAWWVLYGLMLGLLSAIPATYGPLLANGVLSFLSGVGLGLLYLWVRFGAVLRWVYQAEEEAKHSRSSSDQHLATTVKTTGIATGSEEQNGDRTSGTHAGNKKERKNVKLLEIIIDDAQGLSMLTTFLRAEFSVENILFLVECKKYAKMFESQTPEILYENCKKIIDQFVVAGSPFCINISGRNRDNITNNFRAISPESMGNIDAGRSMIFQEAERDVAYLILYNSFPRFIHSAEFKRWNETRKAAVDDF